MAEDNIVEFKPKSEQKQDPAEVEFEQYMNTLPEHVRKELNQYDELIKELSKKVDDTLYQFAITQERRDISMPLEALIRVFANTANELDSQIQPEAQPGHLDIRSDLANYLNGKIQEFIMTRPIAVYQQDIMIAVSYVLISYLFQQRIHSITHIEKEESEGNDEHSSEVPGERDSSGQSE